MYKSVCNHISISFGHFKTFVYLVARTHVQYRAIVYSAIPSGQVVYRYTVALLFIYL